MRLDPTLGGHVAKDKLLNAALDLLARGRLCAEARCLEEAEVAVRLQVSPDQVVEAGLCLDHGEELGRDPTGISWPVLGFRMLEDEDEILDGPLPDEEAKP